MGFSTIATQIIFLFIFILALASFISLTNQNAQAIDDANRIRAQMDNDKTNTKITIIDAQFDENILTLTVQNDGPITLDPSKFRFYVDTYPPKTISGLTPIVDFGHPRLMDHKDIFEIGAKHQGLESGTHRIILTTPTGASAAYIFST